MDDASTSLLAVVGDADEDSEERQQMLREIHDDVVFRRQQKLIEAFCAVCLLCFGGGAALTYLLFRALSPA